MKKLTLKLMLAAAVALICAVTAGAVTVPKWVTGHNPQTLQTAGFDKLPENSADVLVLGSCQSYQGFNPAVFWKECGLTSYVLASPDQRLYASYYYLLYALEKQSPSLVLLDALFLVEPNTPSAAFDSKAYIPMKLSREKLEFSDFSFRYAYGKDKTVLQYPLDRADNLVKTVLPVFSFHARTDYTAAELSYLAGGDFDICFNGGIPFYYTRDLSCYSGYMEPDGREVSADPLAERYLEKIEAICRERGIKLVLYKTPAPSRWGDAEHRAAASAAGRLGLDFFDYNAGAAEYGFDLATQFHTPWKLNADGMELQTKLLCRDILSAFPALADAGHSAKTKEYYDRLYEKYLAKKAGSHFTVLPLE